MANEANERFKRYRNEEFEKRGNYCQNLTCAFTNWELTFAHLTRTAVRGRGRGRKERIADIRKYPGAYALLCWDCHRAFDRGELDALIIINRSMEADECITSGSNS